MNLPINVDFASVQMEHDDSECEVVLLAFEGADGMMVLRLPAAGAAELQSLLSDLPLGHRPPHR
jgi:hypothetical protein